MKAWLKGALWGLIIFILVFVVLSLINTGKISISDAFGYKEPYSVSNFLNWLNYIVVLIFILVGAFIGWIIGKIKQKKEIKK